MDEDQNVGPGKSPSPLHGECRPQVQLNPGSGTQPGMAQWPSKCAHSHLASVVLLMELGCGRPSSPELTLVPRNPQHLTQSLVPDPRSLSSTTAQPRTTLTS